MCELFEQLMLTRQVALLTGAGWHCAGSCRKWSLILELFLELWRSLLIAAELVANYAGMKIDIIIYKFISRQNDTLGDTRGCSC